MIIACGKCLIIASRSSIFYQHWTPHTNPHKFICNTGDFCADSTWQDMFIEFQ